MHYDVQLPENMYPRNEKGLQPTGGHLGGAVNGLGNPGKLKRSYLGNPGERERDSAMIPNAVPR
jgi:hypothetical protein